MFPHKPAILGTPMTSEFPLRALSPVVDAAGAAAVSNAAKAVALANVLAERQVAFPPGKDGCCPLYTYM